MKFTACEITLTRSGQAYKIEPLGADEEEPKRVSYTLESSGSWTGWSVSLAIVIYRTGVALQIYGNRTTVNSTDVQVKAQNY